MVHLRFMAQTLYQVLLIMYFRLTMKVFSSEQKLDHMNTSMLLIKPSLLSGGPTSMMIEVTLVFLLITMIAIVLILLKTRDGVIQIIGCGQLAIFLMAYQLMEDA